MNSSSSCAQEVPQELARPRDDLPLPEDSAEVHDADLDYSTGDEGAALVDTGAGKRAREVGEEPKHIARPPPMQRDGQFRHLRDAAMERASSRGRAFVQTVSNVVRRAATPTRSAVLKEETAAQGETPPQDEEATDAEKLASLREEVEQLKRDRDHQSEQRKVLQASLASERSRSEKLAKQNEELSKAAEERLKGQQRVSDVETSELAEQVEALLMIKRQLFERMTELESERNTLLFEREEGTGRTCVACLDHLANTVLIRCRHLVCCDSCAKRITHCPVCRQRVSDRLTVFVA